MPFRIGTVDGITLRLLQRTDLLLGRQRHHLIGKTLFFQETESLLRHRPCDCLRREIKNLLAQTLSYGFYRRKHRGDGLSHTRRRLNKDFLLPLNGPINCRRQIFLAFPVRKRKAYLPDGCLAFLLPENLKFAPFSILPDQFIEPLLKLLRGINIGKPPDLLAFQIAVGHLDPDL